MKGLMLQLRTLSTLAIVILSLLLTGGCDDSDDPPGLASTIKCGPSSHPSFLESKLDDDDGDGYPWDEDFPTINDEDDDIADHTWIKDKTGVYHLFFHNEGLVSGNEIEHYTSSDLRSLDYVGVALRPNPNGWDSHGLWAPHVIQYNNTYYMFYTGIDSYGPDSRQRIGLAMSKDLMNWTRYPVNNCPGTSGDGCIYECNEPWTTWGDSTGSFNHQCRDPFVIWDSALRQWVMFATAKSTNQFGVVAVAYSANLSDWAGAGFIDATRRLTDGIDGQITGGQAENPHIMSHDGVHYLLFTDWRDPEDSVSVDNPRTIVQYAISPVLTADSLGSHNWLYRGYITDPGVNAIEVLRIDRDIWLMSQSIANERSGYWIYRRKLRLKCVIWENNFSFTTSNPRFLPDIPCEDINPLSVFTSSFSPTAF